MIQELGPFPIELTGTQLREIISFPKPGRLAAAIDRIIGWLHISGYEDAETRAQHKLDTLKGMRYLQITTLADGGWLAKINTSNLGDPLTLTRTVGISLGRSGLVAANFAGWRGYQRLIPYDVRRYAKDYAWLVEDILQQRSRTIQAEKQT